MKSKSLLCRELALILANKKQTILRSWSQFESIREHSWPSKFWLLTSVSIRGKKSNLFRRSHTRRRRPSFI